MRIVFAGSPAAAIPSLDALIDGGFEVVEVISQPDRPVGRTRTLTPTPVKARALERRIPVSTPASGTELLGRLVEVHPDLAITVAYGRLIGPQTLAVPTFGWWNVHFSRLPRWRGATPVQHAILAGDRETGVSVFQLDEGLDTGGVLGFDPLAIGADTTAGELLGQLSQLGANLLLRLLRSQQESPLTPVPQHGDVSYAPKWRREDARLPWGDRVERVYNRFRAATPEPGAYTASEPDGVEIRILEARAHPDVRDVPPGHVQLRGGVVYVGCGDGALELRTLQPSGKKPMPAKDWWNGVAPGIHFAL